MEIKELIKQSHENAVQHGFWNEFNSLPTLGDDYLDKHGEKAAQAFISQFLMLIVSEVAEAQEGLRHNDMNNFKEELADICIRTFDLAKGLDIDLEYEILKKMQFNKTRPYKHGKSF
jgi:NTP pyrophosphatase (non-canonical NTP hydrolase)